MSILVPFINENIQIKRQKCKTVSVRNYYNKQNQNSVSQNLNPFVCKGKENKHIDQVLKEKLCLSIGQNKENQRETQQSQGTIKLNLLKLDDQMNQERLKVRLRPKKAVKPLKSSDQLRQFSNECIPSFSSVPVNPKYSSKTQQCQKKYFQFLQNTIANKDKSRRVLSTALQIKELKKKNSVTDSLKLIIPSHYSNLQNKSKDLPSNLLKDKLSARRIFSTLPRKAETSFKMAIIGLPEVINNREILSEMQKSLQKSQKIINQSPIIPFQRKISTFLYDENCLSDQLRGEQKQNFEIYLTNYRKQYDQMLDTKSKNLSRHAVVSSSLGKRMANRKIPVVNAFESRQKVKKANQEKKKCLAFWRSNNIKVGLNCQKVLNLLYCLE